MSPPSDLSFEEILSYMLEHGGKVTNHDLVKHFKKFLTNPNTKGEARQTFKNLVNTLATIKTENNEKWLVLKKKYLPPNDDVDNTMCIEKNNISSTQSNNSLNSNLNDSASVREPPPYKVPPVVLPKAKVQPPSYTEKLSNPLSEQLYFQMVSMNNDLSKTSNVKTESIKEIPADIPKNETSVTNVEKLEKSKPIELKHSMSVQDNKENVKDDHVILRSESNPVITIQDADHKISVKERKQMFNRMASEGDVLRLNVNSNRKNTLGVDEEDRASVVSLDRKGHEWILYASRADYHSLAKLLSENPKYAKLKDPATTAMHWACKRGDMNVVKLIGGIARSTVNVRSGYTPLHIAMQFRHENVFELLVRVYDADQNMRDWSGRKAYQYLNTRTTNDSFNKQKQHKKKSELDLGFLRIGSLNARVKKTTEAVSNFLGYGTSAQQAHRSVMVRSSIPNTIYDKNGNEHLHKMWGSADNIQSDGKIMPPPQAKKVKQQRYSTASRYSTTRSTPTTPRQPRASVDSDFNDYESIKSRGSDSDSDSAFGFDSSWHEKRHFT